MMNEQVRNYFKKCRQEEVRKIFQETHCINLEPEGPYLYLVAEGQGEGVRIPVTDEDRKFVHRVQFLFRKQGGPPDSVPAGWRVLATKYALLHPAPLHNYVAKWDGPKLKIYESRRISRSSRTSDHFAAEVGPVMNEFYAKANKKGFDKKSGRIEGMEPGRETDEIVAKWWMDENKDALQDFKDIPSPQVKIVNRGTSRVTLAFRANTKEKYGANWKYQWYEVKDIPIDMNAFRKHVEDHGFDELLHAGHVVRIDKSKWQRMIEPEFTGKNKAGYDVPHPKLKDMRIIPAAGSGFSAAEIRDLIKKKDPEVKVDINDETGNGTVYFHGDKVAKIYAPGYIVPGHQQADSESSDEFNRQYSQNPRFRKLLDGYIKASSIAAIRRYGRTPEPELVRELFQAAFDRFLGRTSKIPDNDWANWEELLGDPDKWVCGRKTAANNTPFGNKLCQMIGGSAQQAAKIHFGATRAGGSVGVFAAGSGGDQEDSGRAERGVEDEKSDFLALDNAVKSPDALVAFLSDRENARFIHEPKILAAVKKWANMHPILGQIAAALAKQGSQPPVQEPEDRYGDFDDEYEDDDESPGSMGRYDPRGVRHEYSFQAFLQRKLNEMGVVWGNDKASAKKLKPHQTLKGGIQVFGAPWTAGGGPNNKDNDVKVKG